MAAAEKAGAVWKSSAMAFADLHESAVDKYAAALEKGTRSSNVPDIVSEQDDFVKEGVDKLRARIRRECVPHTPPRPSLVFRPTHSTPVGARPPRHATRRAAAPPSPGARRQTRW